MKRLVAVLAGVVVLFSCLVGGQQMAHAAGQCRLDLWGNMTCDVDHEDSASERPGGKTLVKKKLSLPNCRLETDFDNLDQLRDAGEDPADYVQLWCVFSEADGTNWLVWRRRAQTDPADVARSLLASIRLSPIRIGMVPFDGRDSMGTVGTPVWMWVDEPDASTWGPKSASDQGVSITARVSKVVWDMGNGDQVSCGKGTEWRPKNGIDKSPTCGYIYEKQGRYTITATTEWTATWTGLGQSGSIPFTLDSSRQLTVGEYQVIVTG
jgi:hypothetical protein